MPIARFSSFQHLPPIGYICQVTRALSWEEAGRVLGFPHVEELAGYSAVGALLERCEPVAKRRVCGILDEESSIAALAQI